MTNFALSQIIVSIVLLIDLLSFQFKAREKILLSQLVACAILALHFYLLSQPTAAVLFSISAVRFGVSIWTSSNLVCLIFVSIAILATAITYSGPTSLLSLGGTLLYTVASFRAHDRGLRLWMMAGSLIWIVHNIIVGSPVATLVEANLLLSNLIGYWRYYLRESSLPQRS